MDIVSFCENEIRLYKDRVKNNPDFEYNVLCLEAALDVIKLLSSQGHSGCSLPITLEYVKHLSELKPLTPITEDEEYIPCSWKDGQESCARVSNVYRNKDKNGKWVYHDINRVVTVIKNSYGSGYWNNGFISKLISDMFPIKMPYMPFSNGPEYVVNVYEYLRDKTNGDYDTFFVNSVIDKKTNTEIPINRYFTEDPISKDTYLEISREQFLSYDYLDGTPPITEEDTINRDGSVSRCPSVYCIKDSKVKFFDTKCADFVDGDKAYQDPILGRLICEVYFPITLPYIPITSNIGRYRVYGDMIHRYDINTNLYHIHAIVDTFDSLNIKDTDIHDDYFVVKYSNINDITNVTILKITEKEYAENLKNSQ